MEKQAFSVSGKQIQIHLADHFHPFNIFEILDFSFLQRDAPGNGQRKNVERDFYCSQTMMGELGFCKIGLFYKIHP